MGYKRFLKYITFLVLIVGLGVLSSFSLKRNSRKEVKEIVVEFEAGDNNFLTHSMVNKLLIQNGESVKNQAKSVIDLYVLENTVTFSIDAGSVSKSGTWECRMNVERNSTGIALAGKEYGCYVSSVNGDPSQHVRPVVLTAFRGSWTQGGGNTGFSRASIYRTYDAVVSPTTVLDGNASDMMNIQEFIFWVSSHHRLKPPWRVKQSESAGQKM